jgi:hypothetical protein
MPAADFCRAIRKNLFLLRPDSGTRRRPPEVSSTAFSAQPPDLPPAALMDLGFAVSCPLARCRRPHHPVFVHRLAPLLHAAFRPRLTTTPLRFAIPSPPSGWEEDFHLQAVEHARHTRSQRSCSARIAVAFPFSFGEAKINRPCCTGFAAANRWETPEHHTSGRVLEHLQHQLRPAGRQRGPLTGLCPWHSRLERLFRSAKRHRRRLLYSQSAGQGPSVSLTDGVREGAGPAGLDSGPEQLKGPGDPIQQFR